MDDTRPASPLKAAMTAAGLTTEQFADILGVDVKTVRRWTQGRIPYPRHRIAISHALDLSQAQLWPDLPDTATQDPAPATDAPVTDPVTGYPGPDHPDLPPLTGLIAAATRHIDIADDTLLPPPPDADPRLHYPATQLADPTLIDLLTAKAHAGVAIRVLVGHAERHLAPLLDLPGVQLATGGPQHTIHRADDHLLLGLGAITPASAPRPVLHIHRHTTGGLFDRLLEAFQDELDNAHPIATTTELDQLVDEIEAEREEDLRELEEDPDDEPADPPPPIAGPAPRRWPRRPH